MIPKHVASLSQVLCTCLVQTHPEDIIIYKIRTSCVAENTDDVVYLFTWLYVTPNLKYWVNSEYIIICSISKPLSFAEDTKYSWRRMRPKLLAFICFYVKVEWKKPNDILVGLWLDFLAYENSFSIFRRFQSVEPRPIRSGTNRTLPNGIEEKQSCFSWDSHHD